MPTRRCKVAQSKQKLPLNHNATKESDNKRRKKAMALKTQKKAVKEARKADFAHILQTILNARRENGGKIPHRCVQNIVDSHTETCPWLSRHVIMKGLKSLESTFHVKRNLEPVYVPRLDETPTIQNYVVHREKGGRPKGCTNESKHLEEICVIAAKNEITEKYYELMRNNNTERLPKGTLKKTIDNIINRRNLPLAAAVTITPESIKSRIKRGKTVITRTTGGLYSPLLPMEQAVVDIVIQMARIRVCLHPSDGIRLVRSMLNQSDLQAKLI